MTLNDVFFGCARPDECKAHQTQAVDLSESKNASVLLEAGCKLITEKKMGFADDLFSCWGFTILKQDDKEIEFEKNNRVFKVLKSRVRDLSSIDREKRIVFTV